MKQTAICLALIFLLTNNSAHGQLFGSQNIINFTIELAVPYVHAADIDGDGDMDIISANHSDNTIAWQENLGGSFGPQQIISTETSWVQSVYSTDLDGDGDMDVLSASFHDDKIAWYENLGGNFGPQQIISTQADGAQSVYASDLDGDGDIDVLSASFQDDKIAWYENFGGSFGTQQIISTQTLGAQSVYAADIDGDGDMDVLSASSTNNKVAWYENLGGSFGPQQIISTQADWTRFVYAADLNGDGDMDVLSCSSGDDKIAWYENLGGSFGMEQIISLQADNAQSANAADLDGDGDLDVVSLSWIEGEVIWFENLGGSFGAKQTISSEASGANNVYVADLDGDGDLDVLSASNIGYDSKVAWYENLSGQGCTDAAACNYQPDMWVDNGSCCYSDCGCTDPIAENYNSLATCDDSSCQYIFGCLDEYAANYDSLATADNDSCNYIITGFVYHDIDEDGDFNGSDYGLPFQTIILAPSGLTAITDSDGAYQFTANYGYHTLEVDSNPLFPFTTSLSPISVELGFGSAAPTVNFGISEEQPIYEIYISLYANGEGYPCDELRNHNICFRNMGNVPVDGVVELEYDSLFQGHQAVTPIDSVAGNSMWMSFENLLPGHMFCYETKLHTPAVDYIGEILTSTSRIWGFYDGDTVAYGEKTLQQEVTCAYDPNDKQVFPIGYSDMHYIDNDTVLEYLVRFQNTGNAPATNVRIRDTLDVNLDLSTFELVANSHSVFTSINPNTREVDFFFEDIQLPDSVNNEPESHGLVSFKIRPTADLPLLTELNNTASIFFDNNPPIVTNTTWSTIYDCSLFEVSFNQYGADLIAIEGDNYQWFVDGNAIVGATEQEYLAQSNGNYTVQVASDFPCSGMSDAIFVVISSVDDLSSSAIKLFPNPVSEQAIITFARLEGLATLEILDLTGKLVRSEHIHLNQGRFMLNRNGLASGQYLLQISNDNQRTQLKFLIE